jgi:uncharacterized protein YegL
MSIPQPPAAERSPSGPAGEARGQGFAERIPLVLALDTSDSMNRPQAAPRIEELNAALRDWLADAAADPRVRGRLEVAVVTFGSQVQVLPLAGAPFALVETITPPRLRARGLTLMLQALDAAVALAAERTRQLTALGVPSKRPMIWLITDGAPSDTYGNLLAEAEVEAAARRLRDAESPTADAPGCLVWAVGVAGADQRTLRILAPESTMMLSDFDYRAVLALVTQRASTIRSSDSPADAYAQTRDVVDLQRMIRDLEDEVR